MSNTIDDALAEAVQIVLGLTLDELQEFARQVAMANSAQADRLADALLDAVYDAEAVPDDVDYVRLLFVVQ